MTGKIADIYEQAVAQAQAGKPRLFMESFLSVRDKRNEVVPMTLHRIASAVVDSGENYLVLCKPRQAHMTTTFMGMAYTFCQTIPNYRAAIVAHEKDALERIFSTVHGFHRHMGEEYGKKMAGELDASRADMLRFGGTDSMIYIGTAGGKKFGRGETINMLLLDEFGHYTDNEAREIWTGAPEAVPLGGRIIVSSTPNGIGNKFHNLYLSSKAGDLKYRAMFFPWFLHEEYTLGMDDAETLVRDRVPDALFTPTPTELELKFRYGLTVGQLRWRRMKLAEKPLEFAQEYPEDDVTCFLATTRSVFPAEDLYLQLKEAKDAREVRHGGRLKIWRPPHPSHQYVIGCDPSEGLRGGDPACAQVLDAKDGVVVATLHGTIPIADFARLIAELGREYNEAMLVVERNNHGHAVLLELGHLGYTKLYRHREGTPSPDRPMRPGFPTSETTKKMLVGQTRSALQGAEVTVLDKETLRELVEYSLDESERYGPASDEGHDDRVMALMLAIQGRLESPWMSQTSGQTARRANVAYWGNE